MDFLYFKKVAELINNKNHLKIEDIEKINFIKSGMNKNRIY